MNDLEIVWTTGHPVLCVYEAQNCGGEVDWHELCEGFHIPRQLSTVRSPVNLRFTLVVRRSSI